MPNYILDKAYAIEETDGIGAYLVAVQGTQAGGAKLPGAPNAGAILGVTTHSQILQGCNVAIRKAGIAQVKAAGQIALGAPVNVAGTSGKVKAIDEATGTAVNCLGFAETAAAADGDVIEVFISLHERRGKIATGAPPAPPHTSLAGTPPLDEACDRGGDSVHELAEDLRTIADGMTKLNRRQRNLLASLLAEYM